ALDRGQALCEQGEVARGLLWLAESLDLTDRIGDHELERAVRVNLAEWAAQLSIPGRHIRAPQEVRAVAFSPDGKRVLLGGGWRGARRWALATGEPVGKAVATLLHNTPRTVRAVAYSSDGRTALIGRADGKARLWDLETGQPAGPPLDSGGGDAWAAA